ncbi:MAG: ABC transporter ATP-binding protein [Spirochaetaceae bacterium]|nr:ABC transporter ATP-binding protein [Spirochaetaceae bacterium]
MTPFKFGLHYYKRNVPLALLSQLISFIALTADLLLPLVMELFIDYVICSNTPDKTSIFYFLLDGSAGEVHTMELFIHIALFYMGILLIRLVLVYVRNVLNQVLGLRLETKLREVTYKKLMELDSQTISGYNSGELLQTINSDTIMYKDLFSHIYPNILDALFVLIVSIVVLYSMNPWLLLIPACLTPFFAIALQKFKYKAREKYFAIRANNSGMNLTVQENIEAVRLVRAFTNEEFEKQKFDKANEKLKASHLDQIRLSARFEVLFSTLKLIAYVGTICVSALLVIKGEFYVGFLVACLNYVMKIVQYVTQINTSIFVMQQMNVAGIKMMEFMARPSRVADVGLEGSSGTSGLKFDASSATGGSEKSLSSEQLSSEQFTSEQLTSEQLASEQLARPDIKVDDISLEIDGKKILSHISLDIPYGKKIGIAGSTGSGKSMLLEAIMRNYELSGGKITIGGTDCRTIPLDTLRREFACVFQEAFLFSNTITSNIEYTDDVYAPQKPGTEERMLTAAKNAQAHDFVDRMPLKYETIVGERGIGISGGQKQRLSIARSLYKDSPVLILDDSTSALDIETEKELLKSLSENYPEKTLLISAHRLSSVVGCDEIIYLKDGEIAERGTFKELMAMNGHFAAVYNIQEAQNKSVMNFDSVVSAHDYQAFSERIGRKAN